MHEILGSQQSIIYEFFFWLLDFAKSFPHLAKISVTSVTILRSGGGAWRVTAELNEMVQYYY